MKPYDKPAKRAAITLLCVLSGNALLAFLVAAFIIPHDIIMGGTTGIGIVLNKAIPQMDVSLFVLILNAILLLIGLIALGKKFALTTVASSLLYPVFLGFFQRIPGPEGTAFRPGFLLAFGRRFPYTIQSGPECPAERKRKYGGSGTFFAIYCHGYHQ